MSLQKKRLELKDPKYFGFKNFDAVYEGEVKDNKPHGKGKLIYEKKENNSKLNQITFEGVFEEGEPITGKLCDMFGETYEGKFTSYTAEDGTFLEGGGKIISEDGNEYTGGWYGYEKNGPGTMKYSDGRIFEGLWIDDAPNDGEMIFSDGIKYKGTFYELTEIFDYGEINYPNGYRFKGSFEILENENKTGIHYECSGQIFLNGEFVKEGKIKLVDKDKANFDKLMWPLP